MRLPGMRPAVALSICAVLLAIVIGLAPAIGAPAILTARASIEIRRVMHRSGDRNADIQYSPTGERYLMILTRADVGKGGNWIELLSGKTTSLEAARPKIAARLFSSSGKASSFQQLPVQWLPDGETIAFLWDDGKQPVSLVSLNLRTGSFKQLVRRKTDLTNFSLSADNQIVLYSTETDPLKEVAKKMLRDGFAVPAQDTLTDVLSGNIAGYPDTYPEAHVAQSGHKKEWRVSLPTRGADVFPIYLQMGLYLSPDGGHAIVTAPPSDVPEEWLKYDNDSIVGRLRALHDAPHMPGSVQQYWMVDLRARSARPLWNAPKGISVNDVSWSPDSKMLAIGPAFLPLTEGASAAAHQGSAFAIYDVQSQRYSELPLPVDATLQDKPARWINDNLVLLAVKAPSSAQDAGSTAWLAFHRDGEGAWTLSQQNAVLPTVGIQQPVHLDLRQGLNMPPKLFGTDTRNGRTELLFDLNPDLGSRYRLAHAEFFHWTTPNGMHWTGKLYYPTSFREGERYPLVIKCGLYDRTDSFSVSGDDDMMTIGGVQAMSARNIVTLLMHYPDGGVARDILGTPEEFRSVNTAYVAAIEQLAKSGLIDERRVGVAGVSRCGNQTGHFITSSNFPVSAALIADNSDDSYAQALAAGSEGWRGYARHLGATTIGGDWPVWLRESPGFNMDKVHAPVRLERDSGGLEAAIASWEMFALLRDFGRPVELYFIPGMGTGDHALTNPGQLLASQGGAVDWFDFWLNGHEDTDPKKAEQYHRWEAMCDLQTKANPGAPTFCEHSSSHSGAR